MDLLGITERKNKKIGEIDMKQRHLLLHNRVSLDGRDKEGMECLFGKEKTQIYNELDKYK